VTVNENPKPNEITFPFYAAYTLLGISASSIVQAWCDLRRAQCNWRSATGAVQLAPSDIGTNN